MGCLLGIMRKIKKIGDEDLAPSRVIENLMEYITCDDKDTEITPGTRLICSQCKRKDA